MSTSKKPTHRAYLVTHDGPNQGEWREIAALFPHKDGKGFFFRLKADLPAGQREIIIRAAKKREQNDRGFA